jgi:hypothetical protein
VNNLANRGTELVPRVQSAYIIGLAFLGMVSGRGKMFPWALQCAVLCKHYPDVVLLCMANGLQHNGNEHGHHLRLYAAFTLILQAPSSNILRDPVTDRCLFSRYHRVQQKFCSFEESLNLQTGRLSPTE